MKEYFKKLLRAILKTASTEHEPSEVCLLSKGDCIVNCSSRHDIGMKGKEEVPQYAADTCYTQGNSNLKL